MSIRLLVLAAAVCSAAAAPALTRYSAAFNNFAGTALQGFAVDGRGMVEVDNTGDTTVLVADTAAVTRNHYRYMARFSNSHNRTGRSYRYYTADGRRRSRDHTAAGIAVNISRGDTVMVMLEIVDTAPFDDIRGRRQAEISVTHHCTAGIDTLALYTLTEWIDLADGRLNAVAADVNGDAITVLAGGRELHVVGTVTQPRPRGAVGAAVAVGSAARVALERTVLCIDDDVTTDVDTGLDAAALEARFNSSRDAVEGFYYYLDRDMDERKVRLGGKYTLALVRHGNGYDIVFVDGARVCGDEWYPGRLKGKMTGTDFNANYDLMWLDATGHETSDECYATLEGGTILTLHFPLLDATMRLHRRP